MDYVELNKKIDQVETIISSKYGFKFIEINDNVEDYSRITINVLQCRVLAEGICRYIAIHKMKKSPEDLRTTTLDKFIGIIRSNIRINPELITHLLNIQHISNRTVHFYDVGRISVDSANSAILDMNWIVNWFVVEYSENSETEIFSSKSWTVPPKAEWCIVSRDEEVRRIRKTIVENKVAYIYGATGVGKTELIKDYVLANEKKYQSILYNENIDDIDDYVLNLPIGIDDENQKGRNEIVKEKIARLKSFTEDYIVLLIIDNYTGNIDDLQKILPHAKENYHLLIAIELEDDTDVRANGKDIKLEALDIEDSRRLFSEVSMNQYEMDDIDELIKRISYNPRAIKMSALFLNEHESIIPRILLNDIPECSTVNEVLRNLYLALTDISVLKNSKTVKFVSECICILPYSGFSKGSLYNIIKEIKELQISDLEFNNAWEQIKSSSWIIENDFGEYSISPLLSDVIFEKFAPDLNDDRFVFLMKSVLKVSGDTTYRNVMQSQLLEIEPYAQHLFKRIEMCKNCDVNLLSILREYFIAIYENEKVDLISEIMEMQFKKHSKYLKKNFIEDVYFWQGINRFNLEDFIEANNQFGPAVRSLFERLVQTLLDLAKILPYEATALAAIGQKDESLTCISKAIEIREKLAEMWSKKKQKNEIFDVNMKLNKELAEQERRLWISYYNQAKSYYLFGDYEMALNICNKSQNHYLKHFAINERSNSNLSSFLHLSARILAHLGRYDEAINNIKEAIEMRNSMKGSKVFSTAQLHCYAMEIYEMEGDYVQALDYARKFYKVLVQQYKTNSIQMKIREIEGKIAEFERRIQSV